MKIAERMHGVVRRVGGAGDSARPIGDVLRGSPGVRVRIETRTFQFGPHKSWNRGIDRLGREPPTPPRNLLAQPVSFSAIRSMQSHPPVRTSGSAPPATSLFVFVLVCALVAFAVLA
jgi:hypothetical protein